MALFQKFYKPEKFVECIYMEFWLLNPNPGSKKTQNAQWYKKNFISLKCPISTESTLLIQFPAVFYCGHGRIYPYAKNAMALGGTFWGRQNFSFPHILRAKICFTPSEII